MALAAWPQEVADLAALVARIELDLAAARSRRNLPVLEDLRTKRASALARLEVAKQQQIATEVPAGLSAAPEGRRRYGSRRGG